MSTTSTEETSAAAETPTAPQTPAAAEPSREPEAPASHLPCEGQSIFVRDVSGSVFGARVTRVTLDAGGIHIALLPVARSSHGEA